MVPRGALIVVSDASARGERVLELGRAAGAAGAWGYQIREPGLGGRELARLVEALATACPSLRIIVNDRVDVALGSGAFGAELGERSLAVERVRGWVGDRLRLGRSVHDAAGARAAAGGGADWLVAGHVYPTPAKPGREPLGLRGLGAVVRAAGGRPVVAIGGIDGSRIGEVLGAGAAGVAVIGAVARAADPEQAARELVGALARACGGSGCVKSSP